MADLTGLGAVAESAKSIIGMFFPDKTESERNQLAAALALIQAQTDTNKVEAANPSVFVAGWRPGIGWVCGAGLAYQFVLKPLLAFGFMAAGHPLPELPGIDGNLYELLLGMLGLGGLRTVEKVKGVA